MLVRSLDQIVSLIRGTEGDFDRRLDERGAQPLDPLAGAVVAFADQQHVPVGREIRDNSGCYDLV